MNIKNTCIMRCIDAVHNKIPNMQKEHVSPASQPPSFLDGQPSSFGFSHYYFFLLYIYHIPYIWYTIYGMVWYGILMCYSDYVYSYPAFNPVVSRPIPILGIPFWLVTISRFSCCQLLSSISHSPSPQCFLFLCFSSSFFF